MNQLQCVLQDCPGTFLEVCEDCYRLDPRIIAEINTNSTVYCPNCNGQKLLFIYETKSRNQQGATFYEYQTIRKRLSDTRANSFCRNIDSCDRQETCRFVHTYLEMRVWILESQGVQRKCLSFHSRQVNYIQYHCFHCSRNFENYANYSSHLESPFHKDMVKIKRKDDIWRYRDFPDPADMRMCPKGDEHLGYLSCKLAHSQQELQEWQMRRNLVAPRNGFTEDIPSIDYIDDLHKRVQTQKLCEIDGNFEERAISMDDKTARWRFHLRDVDQVQHFAFLQPIFKLKYYTDKEFAQHIAINTNKPEFLVQFENPGIFGEYNGTLVFDSGPSIPLKLISFKATVKSSNKQEVTPQGGILNQDWSVNRVVIEYPEQSMSESQYESNVKELEKKYKIPTTETLDDIYLENLTPKNYAKQMHNFLYKEEIARQAVLTRLNIECELEFSNHIYFQSGGFLGSRNPKQLFAKFSSPVRLSADSDEGVLIRDSCSKVLIGMKDKSSLAYECKIEQWEKNDIFIYLSERCVNELNVKSGEKKTMAVQFKLNRSMFCQRHYAIDNLGPRVKLICPEKKTFADLNISSIQSYELDQSQNSVLQQIHGMKVKDRSNNTNKKSFPPLIVAGPFGTGKTHTIRNVIMNILTRNGSDARILLCTHSNGAADLYIKDIFDDPQWTVWRSKILRLMYHGRNPRTVLIPEVNNFCLFEEGGKSYRYPTLAQVRQYKIVITTFAASPALGPLGIGLHGNAFTHIFLDEASQAMEPEVIMPLALASVEDTRIIIAGDHMQINERMFLTENVKIRTLLERMYDAYSDSYRSHRILLCNNYRCVDGILQLISELFYKKGILKKTGNVVCIPGYSPVQFIHVQGECQIMDSGDFINVAEAQQILLKINELVRFVDPKDIVVTSAYSSQVTLIRDLLRRNGHRSVTVHSARNLQALQYKVVILSSVLRRVTCLSCVGKNFGFLSDGNLLNTVLTRAKSLVIAVGDAVTLCSTGTCDKKWETYIKHCENSRTIFPLHINMKLIKEEIRIALLDLRATATEFIPSRLQDDKPSTSKGNVQASATKFDAEESDEGTTDDEEDLTSDTGSYSDDSEEDDDDPILNDMLKKATGINPNALYVETDEKGNEMLKYLSDTDDDNDDDDEDPNEIDIKPSKNYAGKKPIFPKHSLGELEAMLAQDPDKYKRCRIHIKEWFSGEAFQLDDSGMELTDSVFHLNSKNSLGRTFDRDEVVVKVLPQENQKTESSEKKIFGQVMGVLKRHKNPKQGYYLCRPDEYKSGIMSPIDKSCTKFAIITPKDQKINSPHSVPVYKIKYKRRQFTSLEMVSHEKINWELAYAVKYLKWVEYCPYPLGFVAKVIPIEQHQKCLEYEFGISKQHKKSVTKQVKKIKAPKYDPEKVIDVFTIDPEDARDLDDALSLEKCKEHKNCYVLGIHITDVTELVKKGDPIDKEAQKRGITLYGPDGTCHMLPPVMSTDKCSLLPDKVRPAISTYFHSSRPPPHISANEKEFIVPEKSFVRSEYKFTYEEAEITLRNAAFIDSSPHMNPEIEDLATKITEIWKLVWSWRCTRLDGAAYYKDPDKYSDLLKEGKAHVLIEEAMLAVNSNTAKYLISKNFPIEVRVQEIPDKKKWMGWKNSNQDSIESSTFLSSTSEYVGKQYELQDKFKRTVDSQGQPYPLDDEFERLQLSHRNSNAGTSNKGIQIYTTVWNDISKCRENGDIDTLLFILSLDDIHPSQVAALDQFRSIQKKSEWVCNRAGSNTLHSSLRLLKYLKCTSPIRRYPDIVIQRCIHRALEGNRPAEKIEYSVGNVEEKLRKFEMKFESSKLAENLNEQPTVIIVCISQMTDANIKMHFATQGRYIPRIAKVLDYGHIMLDMESKDFIEGRHEQEIQRNDYGDVILEQLEAVWRFRFYDYAKDQGYKSTKKLLPNKTDNLTITIPRDIWQNLIDLMKKPPQWFAMDQEKLNYKQKLKKAIKKLRCESEESTRTDKMCGMTRNSPFPIYHHREIRNTLNDGTALQIQLSSWFGKEKLPEPCVQLLSVASDLDICVHHNREPLHIFAHDARTIKDHTPVSLKKYQKIWEPLIRLDAAYNSVKDGSSTFLKGVKISWDMNGSSESSGFDFDSSQHRFEVAFHFCKERYIEFHKSDLLCFRLKGIPISTDKNAVSLDNKGTSYTIVVHGIIVSVDERKPRNSSKSKPQFPTYAVYFKLFDKNLGNMKYTLMDENLWTIEVIPLSFMHRGMQNTLRKLTKLKSNVVEEICMDAFGRNVFNDLPEEHHAILVRRQIQGFPFPLNNNQYEQKMNSVKQRFTIIQGPPGTGKSYMGAQIAATFALLNRLKNPKHPRKVLYCGPSNRAVDVAAGFLKNAGQLKVIRMYSTSLEEKIFPNPIKPKSVFSNPGDDLKQPDENLDNISLHNLIRKGSNRFSEEINLFDAKVRDLNNKFTRKDVDGYKAVIQKAKYEELKKCDIIICTCSLSALLFELKKEGGIKFAQCIIDECGMCSEPETILPLTVADPEQVVLIGDHMQLQPVVRCKKAERLGLGTSLFSKYSDYAGMLTTQYRMDPLIMEFPSEQFYDGKLECDATIFQRPERKFLFGQNKTVFCHIEGEELVQQFKSIRGGDKSKYNMQEARAVVKLLVLLTNETSLKTTDIMVLSPYTAQCHRIKEIIKKSHSHLNDVHVGTIVTSQGSEADFVILSTVRSLPDSAIVDDASLVWQRKHLGFVCDQHQINVAITRAKYGMCIIGNKNLLKTNELWEKMINLYDGRGAVYDFENLFY